MLNFVENVAGGLQDNQLSWLPTKSYLQCMIFIKNIKDRITVL